MDKAYINGYRGHYSSGTANIVSRIVRTEAEKRYKNSYTFMREELFNKIGMYSAVPEADPSGTYVGSSYTFSVRKAWNTDAFIADILAAFTQQIKS